MTTDSLTNHSFLLHTQNAVKANGETLNYFIYNDTGYVDFDVTDDIFYTPLTGIADGRFLSIYDLNGGINLTGHYYELNGRIARKERDIYYANEKIKVASNTQDMWIMDYDFRHWITMT